MIASLSPSPLLTLKVSAQATETEACFLEAIDWMKSVVL